MHQPPDVRLELLNTPDSVRVVASAVDGLVEVLELDALEADAIQTAVAEACKNVVLHAYEGVEGPLAVEIRAGPETIEATVVDHGIGIRPHVGERRYPHNGLGLPIIHQHAWRVTYTNLPGGGTDVRMEFAVEPTSAAPGELAAAVLGRLGDGLAAVAPARVEVLVGSPPGGGDSPLALVQERLGAARFGGLEVQRRTAERDGPALLVLSLSV